MVLIAERQDTLSFRDGTVNRILDLTGCHPYVTQLPCQLLWDDAHLGDAHEKPQVTAQDVDRIVPRVLEAADNVFEWIWDGLPPAERIIFAAIAQGSGERRLVTKEELVEILQRHGILFLIGELDLAPEALVKRDMLREANGNYSFCVELLRRWVAQRKPLRVVKDELDRVVPAAEHLYRYACELYQQGKLEMAVTALNDALGHHPNHLKARMLLGELLRDLGRLEDSSRELEKAYQHDPDAALHRLVRTLLTWGEQLEKTPAEEEALRCYDRVLEIAPHDVVAQGRRAAIWRQRGDRALQEQELDSALASYKAAGENERIAQVEALMRLRDRNSMAAEAELCKQREQWERAIEIYRRLGAEAPQEVTWRQKCQHAEALQRLSQLYTEGIGARGQGHLERAVRALAEVVGADPFYKDAARLLAEVVQISKAEKLPDRRSAPITPARLRKFSIQCPYCATHYEIDGARITGTNRMFKCSRCRHAFHWPTSDKGIGPGDQYQPEEGGGQSRLAMDDGLAGEATGLQSPHPARSRPRRARLRPRRAAFVLRLVGLVSVAALLFVFSLFLSLRLADSARHIDSIGRLTTALTDCVRQVGNYSDSDETILALVALSLA